MAENELPGWRRKFLANRMTFESILFERELVMPKKEKLSTGMLVAAGIWLLYSMLLAQWVLRRGYFFPQVDAESFSSMLRYAEYFKTQGWWALIKPDLASATLNPPLYYLAYIPVIRFITPDLNQALILVNSFFLLILAFSVFFLVRKSRPNRAGWLGTAFALSLPFVLETARRPAPEIALLAVTAGLYACYVQSDDLEHPKWGFWFAVFLGLGFYSHRFFWLYVLPLVPFILEAIANPNSREEIFKGIVPGAVINLPWYLFAAAAAASGLVPLQGEYLGFFAYLRTALSSAGLPLFCLGALALAWMYFSVFMPYEKRKVVAAWFWVPYLVLAWGVRGDRPELLYPALLPFAVALPVMTPHALRRYLLPFVILLGAANQSGLVPPLSLGGYRLAGLPLPPARAYRAAEILAAVKDALPGEGGLVGIYGADANLNADSLRFASEKDGVKARFESEPACPACPVVLIRKTQAAGAAPSASARAFSGLQAKPWFAGLFEKKAVIDLADSTKAEIYVKVPERQKMFEDGPHEIRNLVIGPFKMETATLTIEGYDAASGAYAKASLFCPTAQMSGGDIYGFTLALEGLRLAGTGQEPVLAGIKSARVVSAKVTDYALERYLAEKFPLLSGLKVALDDTLDISATVRGMQLNAAFTVATVSPGVVEIKPAVFSAGWLNVPPFMLKLFASRVNFSDNPYGLKVSGMRLYRNMLDVY